MVKVWGPLWCYSMFGFENINGYLGRTYHGTRHITSQMSFNIQLQQSLPHKLKELCKDESDSTRLYLESLVQDKRIGMQRIGVNCYSVGKVCSDQLTEKEKHALLSLFMTQPPAPVIAIIYASIAHQWMDPLCMVCLLHSTSFCLTLSAL